MMMMIIAGLWRHGDWRHVATGCNALVTYNAATATHNVLNVQTSILMMSSCRSSMMTRTQRRLACFVVVEEDMDAV